MTAEAIAIDDYLVPQANNVAVLSTVVDAVADGCTTASDIADAVGMSGRQGAYYPHAAALLGLVEAVADTSPMEWQLTEQGAYFVGCSADGRAGLLADAISSVSYVDTFLGEDGAKSLAQDWGHAGLGTSTIKRRTATIASWAEYVTGDRGEHAKAIATAMTGTRERTPGVRAAAAERAHKKKVAQTPRICNSCFIAIPTAFTECRDCN